MKMLDNIKSKILRPHMIVLLAIVILSVWMRTMGANFGLPYKWYWDEAKIFWFAYKMIVNKTVIPELFRFGSPVMYFEAVIMLVLGWGSNLLVNMGYSGETIGEIASSFGRVVPAWPISIQFIRYSLYIGRVAEGIITGISSLGVYYLAREVFNRRSVGLLAAAINAVLFIQVQHSWLLLMSNLGYSLIILMVILSYRYYLKGNAWLFSIIGFFTGLTISTKYSLLPIIIVPVIAFILKNYSVKSAQISNEVTDQRRPWNWAFRLANMILVLGVLSAIYVTIFAIAIVLPDEIGTLIRDLLSFRQIAIFLAIAGVALILSLAFGGKKVERWFNAILAKIPFRNLYHLVCFAAGTIFSGVLFNLGLLFKTKEYLDQVLFQSDVYFGGDYKGSISPGLNMLYRIGEYFYLEGLGPILFLLALFGFVVFWIFPKADRVTIHKRIILISFPLTYLAFYSFTRIFNLRNYLTLSSFLAILSAFGCVTIYDWILRMEFFRTDRIDSNRALGAAVVILLLVPGVFHHFKLFADMAPIVSAPDTRTETILWLTEQESLADKLIVFDEDLDFSSIELDDLPINHFSSGVEFDGDSLTAFKDMNIDLIVTTKYKLDKIQENNIKSYLLERTEDTPTYTWAQHYYQMVLEESLLEIDSEVIENLTVIAEFSRPEHTSVLGTDFYLLYSPGVTVIPDHENSVSVILNPHIIVYMLGE